MLKIWDTRSGHYILIGDKPGVVGWKSSKMPMYLQVKVRRALRDPNTVSAKKVPGGIRVDMVDGSYYVIPWETNLTRKKFLPAIKNDQNNSTREKESD